MMINKQTAFANNQVFALFYLRDIRRTVLPQKLCMEMPCCCPFEGHKYGPPRKPTETSVSEFSYKCVNSLLEELIEIKVILILRQGMFRF